MEKVSSDSTLLLEEPFRPETAPAFKLGYRPELDGLRGVSILLVFIHHVYYPHLSGGFFGVDIFFVLSGFLITSLLIEEWERMGSISLRNFYLRRALRLMPAALTVVLAALGYAVIFLDGKSARETYRGVWLTLSYASNWFYAFEYVSVDNPLGITWSLAVEEQFYLVWPLLLGAAFKARLGRRWLIAILLLCVIVIAWQRKSLAEHGASALRLYYASEMRADALLIGCLVGLLMSWNLLPRHRLFEAGLRTLAAVALAFVVYLVWTAVWFDPMLYQGGGLTLVALSVAVVLMALLWRPPKTALLILRFAPLVWVGRVSYGLYLWHWPILWFVYRNAWTSANVKTATVGLSLLTTTLSFYSIERPFLRWKRRFSPGARAPKRGLKCDSR